VSHRQERTYPSPSDLEVIGAVVADDRAWFRSHPGRLDRMRAMVPGEGLVDPAPEGHVWVAWIVRLFEGEPGPRLRSFCAVPEHLATAETLDASETPDRLS